MKTMRKICIINQKGGVGKTTTAVNIAAGLARAQKRVLLIDLDPQGNIETSLGGQSQKTLYHYLMENAELGECTSPLGTNLDIIRSDEALTKADTLLAREGRVNMLIEAFKDVKKYDYIIIDCAPSLGTMNQNAMLYCDEAIIPTSTDYLGLDGLQKMIRAIEEINDHFRHSLRITRIIPTQYDARIKANKKTLHKMQNDYYEKLTEPIRTNSKLKEAPEAKKSIYAYAPSSRGAKDYTAVTQLILTDETKQESAQPQAESIST